MTTSEAVEEIGGMADMLELYAKIPKTSVKVLDFLMTMSIKSLSNKDVITFGIFVG